MKKSKEAPVAAGAGTEVLTSTLPSPVQDVKLNAAKELDARLQAGGITNIDERQRYGSISTGEALKFGYTCDEADFEILYHDLDGTEKKDESGGVFSRLRQTVKAVARGFAKYLSRTGAGIRFFYTDCLIKNPTSEILLIAEGEKKASVLASLLFAAMAVIGWSSWRITGSDDLHSDITALKLKGKTVILVPDFDAVFNYQIRRELIKLITALYAAGVAEVRLVQILSVCADKLGIDDYLIKVIDISPAEHPEAWSTQAKIKFQGLIDNAALLTVENCQGELDAWLDRELAYFGKNGYKDKEPAKNFKHLLDLVRREDNMIRKDALKDEICRVTNISKAALNAELKRIVKPVSGTNDEDTYSAVPVRYNGEEKSEYPGVSNFYERRDSSGKISNEPINSPDIVSDVLEKASYACAVVCGVLGIVKDFAFKELAKISDLFAWLNHRTGHNTEWGTGMGFVGRDECYSAMLLNAPQYDSVCTHTQFYKHPKTLYVHPDLPEATGEYFPKLLEFYNPKTAADRIALASAFAAALWGNVATPQIIIESQDKQGSGKSTIVKHIAYFLNQSPITLMESDINNPERVKRRLLSSSALDCEIVLADNVDKEYRSAGLADLITCDVISGMTNHGKIEVKRINDLVYFVTINLGSADRDQSSRSFFIYIDPPVRRDPRWETDVLAFIDENRLAIHADILAFLKQSARYRHSDGLSTRFPAFETEVAAAFCKDQAEFDNFIDTMLDRQKVFDADKCRSMDFADAIDAQIGLSVPLALIESSPAIGIPNSVLGDIYRRSTKEKVSQTRVGVIVRSMLKNGELPNLHEIDRLDANTRGVVWAHPGSDISTLSGTLREIKGNVVFIASKG